MCVHKFNSELLNIDLAFWHILLEKKQQLQNTKHYTWDRQTVCDMFKKCFKLSAKINHTQICNIFKHVICHTLNCVIDFAIIFHFLTVICFAKSSARLMHLIISERMCLQDIKYDETCMFTCTLLLLHVRISKKLQLQSIFLACFSVFY